MGQSQSNPSAPSPEDDPSEDPFPPDRPDRPLPEDAFDPAVLATFKCPFQEPDKTLPHTPYYCQRKSNCPFGHQDPGPTSPHLRILPKCFCVNRLLSQCESTQLERLNPGNLVRCETGFHPDVQDLIEPERFVRLVAGAILGRSMTATDAHEQQMVQPECVICLNTIPTLGSPISGCNLSGFLENCIHRFCLKCIQKWRLQRQTGILNLRFLCPTCRAPSSRIMLWPESSGTKPTKRARLFALQKEFLGLRVGAQTMVAITQVDHNDNIDFLLYFNGLGYQGKVLEDRTSQDIRPIIRRALRRGVLPRGRGAVLRGARAGPRNPPLMNARGGAR